MRYIIALYEIDRAADCAETGKPRHELREVKRLLALASTEDRALHLADRANQLLERLQQDLVPASSPRYRGGRFTAVVYEWTGPLRQSAPAIA